MKVHIIFIVLFIKILLTLVFVAKYHVEITSFFTLINNVVDFVGALAHCHYIIWEIHTTTILNDLAKSELLIKHSLN